MSEAENIECHIDMLIDNDVLVRIGADKLPHRDLSQRVMRIFVEFNTLTAENKNLTSQRDELVSELARWKQNFLDLKAALEEYGGHTSFCQIKTVETGVHKMCTCGFEQALKGKVEK